MPPRKRQKTAKAAAAEEAAKTKRGPKPVEQVTEAVTSNLSDKDLNTIISNVVPAVTQGILQVLKDLKVIPPENPQNQNFEEEQLPLPTQSSSASVPTPLLAASGTNPNSATFLRPLFLGIDEKIKSKIVADQFVELDSILDNGDYQYQLVENGSGEPSFKKVFKSSTSIKTLDQWFKAFHIFTSVYTDRHPTSAPALMKHCDTVHKLAKQSRDSAAIFYDRQFRLLKEARSASISYGEIDTQLYTQALAMGLIKPKQKQSFLGARSKQNKPCFDFNNGSCAKKLCTFQHRCQKCSGPHGRIVCSKKPAQKEQSNLKSKN
ncbi:uncharacterized protein LOC128559666 [Mercenaria mercenaria]|uniref:uncharacterized protein LOC128559666 n=1 Tax=Mercenaria mercenaria TaxID=6596 RepID=UPI00234E5063|nr:uncharacterized protein LOC128559666 [Mercenaria mercenaria]